MTSTATKPSQAYLIGVTGSIGTGKSLIGKQLQEMGYTVIDTDHLAHELLNNPGPTYDKVLARFGQDIADGPGKPVNREKLGKIVFANPAEKTALEAIMLPAIRALLLERVADKTGIVFVLVPLLFETNSQSLYNEVWAVTVRPDIQLVRLRQRDKRSDEELKARIATQFSQEKKAAMATLTIGNSGSPEETRVSVVKALDEAKTRAQAKTGAPAEDKTDKTVPSPADGTKTGDGQGAPNAGNDEQEARYQGMLRNMGQIGTEAALDKLGQVTTTSGKEASASMSVVVKAKPTGGKDANKGGNDKSSPCAAAKTGDASGSAASGSESSNGSNGNAAAAEGEGQERELRVDVRMSVRNRPGVDEPSGPTTPPTPPGPTNPPTPPGPAGKPAPWYHGHGLVYGLFGLLGFLAFVLALYMWSTHQPIQSPPTVIVNPTPVTVNPAPVTVNPPTVNVTVNPTVVLGGNGCNTGCNPTPPPAPCGIDCAAKTGTPCPTGCTPVIKAPGAVVVETPAVDSKPASSASCAPQVSNLDEPPAFARAYLHNQVRWAVAHWTVTATCDRTVVEGFDKEGRVLVRQFYGAYLAYQGQYTFVYLAEGGVQVDKFDNNNIYVQRRIYREAP